jgi:hypothetical protein
MARRMLPEITADWLLARCRHVEGCDCLVWTGHIYVNDSGRDVPKARPPDCLPVQVRRLVWRAMSGVSPTRNEHIIRTCDTWGCVEPAHVAMRGPADELRGRVLPIHQRAKLAEAMRRRSSLTPEVVEQIRASTLPATKEAKLRGCGETTVHQIRNGQRWIEYENNPWLQLA